VNVDDLPRSSLPVPESVPESQPRAALDSPTVSPALVILLCFLLGITAALGIAHQLGAFSSPALKAGPP